MPLLRHKQPHTDKFRVIFETANDGILIADPETRKYVDVNAAMCRMTGYTRDEILNLGLKDLHPPQDLAFVLFEFERAVKTNENLFENLPVMRKDGSVFRADLVHSTIDIDGKILAMAHFRDVTHKKRTEEMLHAAHNRLELLISSSPAVIYTCRYGGDWGATFMSHNLRDVLGYEAEENLETPGFWYAHIHPDDRDRVMQGLGALAQKGYHSHEYRLLHKDGSYRWMFDRVRVVYDSNGLPGECVGSWMDITERKQTDLVLAEYRTRLEAMVEERTKELEQAIVQLQTEVGDRKRAEKSVQRNSALLRSIFHSMQDGLVVADTEQNIIMANGAAEKLLLQNENAIGFKTHKCYEIFKQLTAPCEDCTAQKAIDERLTKVVTLQFNRHGSEVQLEKHSYPLFDDGGVARGIVHYLRDITEQRMLAERARRNDHLAALGQISAGIAHEINNPNSIIMGNAELLHDIWHEVDAALAAGQGCGGDGTVGDISYPELRKKITAMISRILHNSERIGAIVKGIKQYTSGIRQGYTEQVQINEVVAESRASLTEQITQATAKFTLDLGDNIPTVPGARQALEEVVDNLLSNALHALPDRTRGLTITTRHDPASRSVILVVMDEGVGMSADVLRQVMNPFFTTRQDVGGMGLGMSIVHAIVKNHGGTIDLSSAPGQGTVVTVRLPAA